MAMPLEDLFNVPMGGVPVICDNARSPVHSATRKKLENQQLGSRLSSFLESPVCEAIQEQDESAPSPQHEDESVSIRSESLDMLRKTTTRRNLRKSRFSEMLGPANDDDGDTIAASVSSSISGSVGCGTPRRNRRKTPLGSGSLAAASPLRTLRKQPVSGESMMAQHPPPSPMRSPRKNRYAHLPPTTNASPRRRSSIDKMSSRAPPAPPAPQLATRFAPPLLDDFFGNDKSVFSSPGRSSKRKVVSRPTSSAEVVKPTIKTETRSPVRKSKQRNEVVSAAASPNKRGTNSNGKKTVSRVMDSSQASPLSVIRFDN